MTKQKDELRIIGPTHDGVTPVARKYDNGDISVGDLRSAKEGEPIPQGSDLVSLKKTDDPHVFEVDVLYKNRGGPARVSNKAYRSGWDATFGSKDKKSMN